MTHTTQTRPLLEVAADIGLNLADLIPYGHDKAKLTPTRLQLSGSPPGRLILVSAINPTPAGEGKTTTAIGLSMGLRRIGKRALLALREPSLGPVFGVKGGGTGGGRASLSPADDINLHFTGDLHAITTAHNLLAALADNAVYYRQRFGDKGELDGRQLTFGRALDMNDRFLRRCVIGLGGKAHGSPREARFDITAASEVMAVLALSTSYADLATRLGRIVVGSTESGKPVTADDLQATGAMVAVLRDALLPNLVQTQEGGPALVHCGPFANIAHGCSSLLATKIGLSLSDYLITEAGFGFDLGGEKFLDLKCRQLGGWPRLVVLVATLRALKLHGGAKLQSASAPDAAALERGMTHLGQHLRSVQHFGLPAVVALNVFPDDSPDELRQVELAVAAQGGKVARSTAFADGGAGAIDLAELVSAEAERSDADPPKPHFLYDLDEPLLAKLTKVARTVYGADGASLSAGASKDLERFTAWGYGKLPICVAKTQLSLSDDPSRVGLPVGHTLAVRELRLSAGAGFLVALTGEIVTMPGLPQKPAAWNITLTDSGHIRGLMQNDG
ncbi:MAG: formate--tetrahydrofolate ligase [Myxococcales bacterium]|jgi:formate--tetrahydrofolate ligase|nr:formate--tetrahydrofolate ligase [Myxococcales bacterium]